MPCLGGLVVDWPTGEDIVLERFLTFIRHSFVRCHVLGVKYSFDGTVGLHCIWELAYFRSIEGSSFLSLRVENLTHSTFFIVELLYDRSLCLMIQCRIYTLVNTVTLLKRLRSFSSLAYIHLLCLFVKCLKRKFLSSFASSNMVFILCRSGHCIDAFHDRMSFYLCIQIATMVFPADMSRQWSMCFLLKCANSRMVKDTSECIRCCSSCSQSSISDDVRDRFLLICRKFVVH